MSRNSKRPKLFESTEAIRERMKGLGESLERATINAGVKALQDKQPEDITVKVTPNSLEVTQKKLDSMGVIDLKPFFARSPKRKIKDDGGWYMVVPIARKTRGMSRRMYDQLRAIDIRPDDERTVVSSYLYDRRRESDATMLNYTPKSQNITKKAEGSTRHSYTSYRVVSDKSPANSWIINRGRVNKEDTSEQFIKDVDTLMRWKMSSGFK